MPVDLVCVDPAKVDEMWPHVVGLIGRAMMSGIGDDDIATVEADVRAGRSLLWIVWDGERIVAAATTKLIAVSIGKLCVITSCAGRDLNRWLRFIADLESYAKDEGCTVMRIYGRHGWKQMLPHYREPWVAIEKRL